jgi:hypothetical protein
MPTTRSVMHKLGLLNGFLGETANLTYGVTIGAHAAVAAGVIQQPLLAAGVENTILNNIPLVGMSIAALRMIYSAGNLILAVIERRRDYDAMLAGFSSAALSEFASENQSQIMTIGSAAFGYICLGFAIQALGDFAIALRQFLLVRKGNQLAFMSAEWKERRYLDARNNLIVSTFNLIGWGAIAAAHLSVFATAATPLLLVGAACLVAGALYTGGAAVYKASNERKEASDAIMMGGGKARHRSQYGGAVI